MTRDPSGLTPCFSTPRRVPRQPLVVWLGVLVLAASQLVAGLGFAAPAERSRSADAALPSKVTPASDAVSPSDAGSATGAAQAAGAASPSVAPTPTPFEAAADSASQPRTPPPEGEPLRIRRGNRLPSVRPNTMGTASWSGKKIYIRERRTLRLSFDVTDEDGDPVQLKVLARPRGASFEEDGRVLVWTPSARDIGSHELRLELSDGIDTVGETLHIVVHENRLPQVVTGFATWSVGREVKVSFARDPNGDPISFQTIALPAGAELSQAEGQLMLMWVPTKEQLGKHEIVVDVSDGLDRARLEMSIVVVPAWSSHLQQHMVPEVGVTSFVRQRDGRVALGGSFGVNVVAERKSLAGALQCNHNDKDCAASHQRLYAQFEVLEAVASDAPAQFTYAAGYSTSFETVVERRWLIPVWGVEAGGLASPQTGHLLATRPYLGVLLWSDEDLWVSAMAGYRFVALDLEEHSGPSFGLSAMLYPW